MPDFTVPTVDISPYVRGDGTDAERTSVAQDIDYAASTVGFIQILGHGIPTTVLDGLAAAMDSFFDLDLETKKSYTAPPTVNRGYSAPKSESLSLSLGVESANRMNDFFEAFNIGAQARDFPDLALPASDYPDNVWPTIPQFQDFVSTYFEHAARVARTLTSIFERALGLDEGHFARMTDHSIDAFRMNNYALPEGTVDLDGDLTGMGEHTDYGIVTVLWADRVAGLQVLGTDQMWHDVSPDPDALLVNLGDLTARLTNDRWLSTLHRVKPPIVDGTIKRRRSAAFFHDGNVDAVVGPLPSCIEPGARVLYEPVTVAEHIQAKLAGSRSGKSNASAVRERARLG